MKESRYQFIRALNAQLDGLSDGAFLGVMQDRGVSVDDLAAFADEFARRKDSYKKAKRSKDRRRNRAS